MKVALINFSGNVGKSTLAKHLLAPRISGAQVFSIESINAGSLDGTGVEQLRGKQFGELSEQLLGLADAVVDVGASNVEDFVKYMSQYQGSHEDIDYFLIPTVKERKQQADTMQTIKVLNGLGISPKKIMLVFNKVDVEDAATIEDDFVALFNFHEKTKSFVLKAKAVIFANEVFERIKSTKLTIGDVVADEKDYREALRIAKNEAEKEDAIRMISMKRLAASAHKNLEGVYSTIFG